MEQKTVFIGATGYDHYCTEGRKKLLDAGCCLIENQLGRPYTAEELKAIGGEINAVICGCEVWNEETIAAAPNLKVIVKFGVGVDNIDQEAAKRHGVQVANCPGMNSVAVAEQTFALLLGCMREVPALDRAVREGRWDRRVFPEIYGSVFGVLGFGAAGREIALRARAFGAEVLAYDKYPNYAFAEQTGAKIVSLDEVLEQSDIISVNLPALPDTLHIINAENIARMRDGVVIVNAARGVLADETAVAAALESGKIFAYATDVYESEPVQGDSPLIHCKRAVLSPHLAGESTNSYRKIGNATAEGVLAVLAGGEVPHRLA